MTTLVITHEVDDVDRWRTSTKREDISVRWESPPAPRPPRQAQPVRLIVECPSLEAFQECLQGEAAADAMFVGVVAQTIEMFVEAG